MHWYDLFSLILRLSELAFLYAMPLCIKNVSLCSLKFHAIYFFFSFPGYFAYTGGTPYIVKLETPSISAGDSVRLCLTFRYSMRSQSGSSLNVSLKSVHDENEVLIYNLVGYHGDTWSEGQVSWTETEDSKVTNKLKRTNGLRSVCKEQRKKTCFNIYLIKYVNLRSCSEALQTVLMNLPLASMT